MRNRPARKQFFMLATAASIGAARVSAAPVEQYPSLIMHGESYVNACAPFEKSRLRIALLKSTVKNAEKAWEAVNALLCSPLSIKSRTYIAGLVGDTVKEHVDSTGSEPTVSTVGLSNDLVEAIMAKGSAWDVTLRTETRGLTVQYFKDEACVQEINLVLNKQRWVINEIGQACD
jgi:hypothetical protein